MSNHLAIATVTETLRQFLETSLQSAVSGATASSVRPTAAGTGLADPGVNVCLFQVTSNAAWRNQDLAQRTGSGQLVQRPRAGYDLHYLLSFYGAENNLEPQRLLGRALQALHSQPILSRRQIRDTVASVTALAGSNLAEESEAVKLTLAPMDLDEMAKLWSTFFQATYALSVVFVATVVLIEGIQTPVSPLPVRERNLQVVPFQRPFVDEVAPLFVEAGGTLTLRGRNLRGNQVRVRFGDVEVAPAEADISATEIRVAVPVAISAGVRTAQVLQLVDFGSGSPSEPHRLFESNVVPFVLRPALAPPNAAEPAFGTVPRGGRLTVDFTPSIKPTQEVSLLVGDRASPLPDRAPNSPPISQANFTVPATAPLGAQLVRLQVDGAQSALLPPTGAPLTGPSVLLIPALVSGSLTVSATAGGVQAQVDVRDESGQAVPAANVSGQWILPDLSTQNAAQPSDGGGVALFSLAGGAGKYVFTVAGILKAGSAFNPFAGTLSGEVIK